VGFFYVLFLGENKNTGLKNSFDMEKILKLFLMAK